MTTFFKNYFNLEAGDGIMAFLRKNMAFIGGLILVTGLVFSPALQSIGVAMVGLSIFFSKPFKINARQNIFPLVLISLLLVSFLSGIYADNHHEFWEKIKVKLPMVLLPIGFFSRSIFTRRQFNNILLLFILSVFLAGAITMLNYFIHFAEINEQLLHSKPIYILYAVEREHNNQVNHIYYSIMLAFAIWGAFYLYREYGSGEKLKKNLILVTGLLLLVFLHVVAARTGLFGFYASALMAMGWLIIKEKKIILGIACALALGLVFITAYKLLPSWQNRLTNAKEDISRMSDGKDINHYSMSMRKEALKTAWEVYKKHPVLGVGAGDLPDEMEKQYTSDNSILIKENRKLPHNQFLQELVTTGPIGLFVLLLVFILPFTNGGAWRNLLFLSFIVICLVAFQVESVIERQAGVSFFCFFYLAILKISQSRNVTLGEVEG